MKKKNIVTARIAMALVWAVVVVGTNGSASAAQTNSENFEGSNPGDLVTTRPNWTAVTSAQVQLSPGGEADGHGLVLRLTNSAEQKWDFGNIPDETAYIQMDMWLPTDSARTLLNDVVDRQASGANAVDTIYTAFGRDGADTISQSISGTWTPIATIEITVSK